MGYNIGVSGLAATQEAIDVTSNNIANAQTVGYKAGEFVFADQFFRAQDPQSKDRAGMGASRLVVRRNQNFGTLTSTQNALDLAISGIGMFVLAKGVSGTTPTQTPSAFQYTRNGQFAVDSQSRIVNENGMFLVGYPADVNGNISDATFSVLTLDQKPLDAKTSTESTIALNLDSRGEPIDAAFDPTKAVTYSQSTAQTVYDSAGNQHTLSTFYRKVQPATLYFYPKVQGDNSAFQFNTQQNIYATGDANGILPTTFTDLINSSASSIATGATSSATLGIASTSNPGSAATTGAPVETLNGTALIAFPAGQSKTYKMTLNDGTELLVEQEKSSTPGSQLVRYKYVADRFEVYATVDGVNVNGDLSGLSSTSPIQPGYVPAQTPGTVVAPTVTTANGQSGATETANVSFGPLTEGQTITLGGLTFTAAKGIVQTSTATFTPLVAGQTLTLNGLTFTAGSGGITAAKLATAFSNIPINTLAATAQAAFAMAPGYSATDGGFTSGMSLANYSTGAANGNTVSFSSATSGPVPSLAAGIVGGTIPGLPVYKKASTHTFTALTVGQTLTLNGLTFTAGAGDASAAQVANAFANRTTGTVLAAAAVSGGTINGTVGAYDSGAVVSSNTVTFTNSAVGAQTDLAAPVIAGLAPGTPVVAKVADGVTGVTTNSVVTFTGLANGATFTLNGLTLLATATMSASEVASAFASRTAGAVIAAGTVVTNGTIGGTVGAFTSGAAGGGGNALVTFTSTTANTAGVANLAAATGGGAASATITTATAGVTPVTESSTTTFGALASGQSVTFNGLTWTAGTSGSTAQQVATAFSSIAAGTASGALAARNGVGLGGSFTAGTTDVAWSINALTSNGVGVTITSATANTPVTDFTGSITVTPKGAPSVAKVADGVAGVTTSSVVTFAQLAANETFTLNGLTITAGAGGVLTATEVATAFASRTAGAVIAAGTPVVGAAANGTISGTVGLFTTGASGGTTQTFTSTTANTTGVTNLGVATGTHAARAPITTATAGVTAVTESSTATFTALEPGQSLTFNGLTFTAGSGGTSANKLATAFSNLPVNTTANTAQTAFAASAGYTAADGSFTGGSASANWSSGVATGANVIFTSATAATPVTDFTGAPAIGGSNPGAPVYSKATTHTFSALSAGQTLTINGLTFTATADASAAEVAAAFSGRTAATSYGTITAPLAVVHGTIYGTTGAFSTPNYVSGVNVTFTSNVAGVTTDLNPSIVAGIPPGSPPLTVIRGVIGGASAVQVANAFSNLAHNTPFSGLGNITDATNGGRFTAGTFSGWSTASNGGSGSVTFTSATSNANVSNLVAPAAGTPPTIVKSDGIALATETAAVTFQPLSAGQTLSLNGLTFTSGVGGTSATKLAAAFSNIPASTDIVGANAIAAAAGILAADGSFTQGMSSAQYATGPATGNTVNFTSVTPGPVNDLAAGVISGAASGLPVVNRVSTQTFSNLAAGQILSLNGLEFTSGSGGTTAAKLASAFSNIAINTSAATAQAAFAASIGYAAADGGFTNGNSGTSWRTGAASGASVPFISATAGAVPDLAVGVISGTAPGLPTIAKVADGVTGVTTNSVVTFTGLANGATFTLNGLTLLATATMSASEVASAFASRTAGAVIAAGTVVTNGTIGGTVGAFTTGASGGTTQTFTSTTANTAGVANLAVATGGGAASATITTATAGVTPVTESSTVDFVALAPYQTITLNGLTWTAGALGSTAQQLATAFANIGPSTIYNDMTAGSTFSRGGVSNGGNFTNGTSSAAWRSTSTISNGGIRITFESTTAATPVTDFAGGPPAIAGTAPGVPVYNVGSNYTFSPLTSGQTFTLNGLTWTAGLSGTTAQQLAAAFANLPVNTAYNDATPGSTLSRTVGGRFTAGATSTTFSSGSAVGNVVTFTSSVPGSVANLADSTIGGIAPGAPSIAIRQGQSPLTESTVVTFNPVSKGQTVTLNGLTFIASENATAAEVAAAFANKSSGVVLNAVAVNGTGGTQVGTISGTVGGFNSGSVATGANAVTFTSSISGTNVEDMRVIVNGTAPRIDVIEGINGSTEKASVVFNSAPMAAGDTISIAGLTFTAGSKGASAAQAAAAFSNLINGSITGPGVDYGTYNGSFIGWNTGAVNSGNTVTFESATPNVDVSNLEVSATQRPLGASRVSALDVTRATPPGTYTFSQGPGVNGATEYATVAFNPLAPNQTMTLGGLTFTAGATGASANQMANAFSNLKNGASTGPGTQVINGSGTYSGIFRGWETSQASGSNVVFTSASQNANVANIVAAATGTPPLITTIEGVTGVTESAAATFKSLAAGQTITMGGLTFKANPGVNTSTNVTFANGLSAGQTVTLNGLTFTATTATTASELAAAFANRSNGEVLTNVAINGAAGTKVGSINGIAGNFKTGPVGVGTNPTLTFACALPGSQAALLPATGQAGVISLTVPTVGVDGGATAEQVAYAFSGIQAGASFANINQLKNLGSALGGEFTAGNLTGWSTNSSNNTATVSFTSSIPNTGITPDLKGTIAGDFPGTPVITSKTDGVANVTQTSTAAFVALSSGQTLQLNGLTFTAGTAGTTPAQLAAAFANIAPGQTAIQVNNSNNLIPNAATVGSFSSGQSLAAYQTGAANGGSVVFSSTVLGPVAPLAAGVIGGTIPGAPTYKEASTHTFTALGAAQTLTLNGLTFTAAGTGATAAEVAGAFSNRPAGTTLTALAVAGGTINGTSGAFSSSAAVGSAVTFTNTTAGAQTDLADVGGTNLGIAVVGGTLPGTPVVAKVADGTGVTTSSVVTFAALAAGETFTLNGLTILATAGGLGLTAAEVAGAFASRAAGVVLAGGNATPAGPGTIVGTAGAFTTGTVTGTTVTFTSTTANTAGVANLAAATGTNNNKAPITTATAGVTGVAESSTATFTALAAGQSLTFNGLTWTAGVLGTTAAQLAIAFTSIPAGTAFGALAGVTGGGSFTAGTSNAAWNSTTATGGGLGVTFTNTVTSNVTDFTGSPSLSGTAPGKPSYVEASTYSFQGLGAGQTLTLNGLVFTATNAASAADIAAAFSAKAANTAYGSAAAPVAVTNGTIYGTTGNFSTPAYVSGSDVTFTSLSNGTAETATYTFAAITGVQTITVNGLEWTAAGAGTTATDLATVFSNLRPGMTVAQANAQAIAAGVAVGQGTFTTGTSGTIFQSGARVGNAVTFTATGPSDVSNLGNSTGSATAVTPVIVAGTPITDLADVGGTGLGVAVVAGTAPGAPPLTVVSGVSAVQETSTVTFNALTAGQTITLNGLTWTAGASGTTASQLADAFANIPINTLYNDGAIGSTGARTIGGSFTAGTSTLNFSTGAATGNSITFRSAIAGPVADLAPAVIGGTRPGEPAVGAITQGVTAVTENAEVKFSALKAGETMTLGGFTYTAGATGATAAQVANAFSGLVVGSMTGPGVQAANGSGSYSGTLSGWRTSVANGNSVIFTSTTDATNVNNLYAAEAGAIPSITVMEGIASTNTLTLSGNGKSQTITFGSNSTQSLNFDKLGVSLTLTTNGDSPSTIARNFDGQSIVISNGNAIGTMAFVGGKNIDSLARDAFGKPAFNSKMSISAVVGTGALKNKLAIDIDSTNMTAFASAAQTYDSSTNGNPFSQLTAYTVDNEGKLVASYDNGKTKVKGQLVIANFNNKGGLIPTGGNSFEASGNTGQQSGDVIYSKANSGGIGAIRSKTVESSNVDLTSELVKLMILQRNYSANSQAVKITAATMIDDALRIGQ